MPKSRRWTDEELTRLERYANQIPRPSLKYLADVFQRTESAIRNKLNTIPSARTNARYTEDELAYIRNNIHRCSVKKMAKHLGRPELGVASVIRRLGLRRYEPDEWCKISARITSLRRAGVIWKEVARIINVEFEQDYHFINLRHRYCYNTGDKKRVRKKWQQVKNTQQQKSRSYASTLAS